jgi:REP element-mobilizing transposase RayT
LHHIIVRGIARRRVFDDDADRDFFIERLGLVLSETQTPCLAWALIPNHFHLLLKTGATPIAAVMKRLLTGYAMHYNRRHRRKGHLFQNRYKSILCQEEAYLLELVRYIHLNPLRAKLVANFKELGKNRYCGHGVLLGHVAAEWQNTAYVLRLFGDKLSAARRCYRGFVQKGIGAGRRGEFSGGGLIRSVGGWSAAKSLRKAGALQKGDERILGDGEFVQKVLADANEALERKYRLKAKGIAIDGIAARVAEIMDLDPADVWSGGKQPKVVKARSLLCYWAASELGVSQVWLSQKLALSQAAISLSVARGRQEAVRNKYEIRTGFITPSRTRGRRCRPLEMLTT